MPPTLRTAILCSPLLLVVAAAGYGVLASRAPLGAQKARLKFAGWALFSGCWITWGLLFSLLTAISPVVSVEGTVQGLRQTGGRDSESEFWVRGKDADDSILLHADYEGPNLTNGVQVRVRYRSYFRAVTYLEVVGGPNAGWSRRESGGILSALVSIGFGGFFLWISARVRALHPDGDEPPPSRDHPPSDVDDKSLLHL